MNREIYLWILFIIAMVAIGLYVRFYYQPAISMSLSMNSSQKSAFPYQKIDMPITLANTGSSPIVNLSFGVYVGNQLHTLYKVTLPPGKQTVIPFNLTFGSKGTYRISAIADPGKLYNIVDRSNTQANTSVQVYNDSRNAPYVYLPLNPLVQQSASMDNFGLSAYTYLDLNYNMNKFSLMQMPALDPFLEPLINLTATYLRNVSYAYGFYNNGSAYSLWFNGYIAPSIMGIAARGHNLNTSQVDVSGKNVTLIRINQNTTLCSWYEGGWVKNLAYEGNALCSALISSNNASTYFTAFDEKPFSNLPVLFNNTYDANFSYRSAVTKVHTAGILKQSSSGAILFAGMSTNLTPNDTCLGVLGTFNGVQYCSEYILPKGGIIGTLSLIRTDTQLGIYNLSIYSLVNTSRIEEQLPINIGYIQGMNVSGIPLKFVSGVHNTCIFNTNFTCSNAALNNGTLSFNLQNKLSNTIQITGIGCFWNVPGSLTPFNESLASNKSTSISAVCYNATKKLGGVYLNIKLGVVVDYRNGNKDYSNVGSAYIVGSG